MAKHANSQECSAPITTLAIGLVTDQTLGTYLRNESNPDNARVLIWTLPIALCGGIGAAFPSYPVIYRK